MGQQDQHRLAKCARQMCDRRIDGDHDIEQRDDGRGVGEVSEVAARMNEVRQLPHEFGIPVAQFALQADKAHRRARQDRRETRKRYGAIGVILVVRRAGPDQSDPQPSPRQAIAPDPLPLRRSSQIWNGGRNCLQARTQRQGKAHERAMQIERGKRLA